MERIYRYVAQWNAEKNKGHIILQLEFEEQAAIEIDSAAELNALCDLLRNSISAAYNRESKSISTAWHTPGQRQAL